MKNHVKVLWYILTVQTSDINFFTVKLRQIDRNNVGPIERTKVDFSPIYRVKKAPFNTQNAMDTFISHFAFFLSRFAR